MENSSGILELRTLLDVNSLWTLHSGLQIPFGPPASMLINQYQNGLPRDDFNSRNHSLSRIGDKGCQQKRPIFGAKILDMPTPLKNHMSGYSAALYVVTDALHSPLLVQMTVLYRSTSPTSKRRIRCEPEPIILRPTISHFRIPSPSCPL
jgi:hypothetical protein